MINMVIKCIYYWIKISINFSLRHI